MSPTEWAARMDQLLRYVGSLLSFPEGTPEWTVGRTFALMGDQARLAYITELVTDCPQRSRTYEIGWDLLAIIQGYPEAVPA